ncbi:MAG TPA: SpoIIE family protein phosphatase [Membranihabitans sp.]|nr:SpoIIE family protein phosphatase [Membranihabitans sp.]
MELSNEENITTTSDVYKNQLNGLMTITEAINENASISQLFDIYQSAIRKYYNPSVISLCINTIQGMQLYSSDPTRKWEDYVTLYQKFSRKKSSYLRSSTNEVYIPVYHKKQLIALVHLQDMIHWPRIELEFLKTMTNFVAIAIENKRLFKQRIEQENYRTQLALARQIQHSLMPHHFADSRELEFKTLYIPHSQIGGDYFDFFHIKNSHVSIFCIADVAGKGIPAALLMANLQASLRRLSINYVNLEFLLNGLNKAVFESTKGDRLVTIFLAAYDVVKNELQYINAGHPYPILQTKNQGSRFLKKGTTPIGISESLPEVSIGTEIIQDETVIFAYTDGLEELRNGHGQMMGHHQILSTLHQLPFGEIEMITDTIEEFIEKFKGNEPIGDDITVLLCKIKPDGIVQ